MKIFGRPRSCPAATTASQAAGLNAPQRAARPYGDRSARMRQARSAGTSPAAGIGRILGCMGRMIWTILGAILAIWLAFMAMGWIFAMLKTFLVIGLIAVVVFIVVWIVAGRARAPKRDL